MRLVLDTNVVVSALISRGAPRELLLLGDTPQVPLFSSDPLIRELSAVLCRGKFAQVTGDPLELVRRYRLTTHPVDPGPVEPVVTGDPDDDMVVATAVAARADVLVTGDKGVLAHHPHRGVRILRPADALREVRAAFETLENPG